MIEVERQRRTGRVQRPSLSRGWRRPGSANRQCPGGFRRRWTATPWMRRARSESSELTARAYVRTRLAGSVWEKSRVASFVYQRCVELGWKLGDLGVTPNSLTYGSVVWAAASGVLAAFDQLLLAALALVLSGLCDALDGMVARRSNRVTRFGALLDSSLDRFADALPLLGLVVLWAPLGWVAALPAAAMLSSLGVSYVRARAEGLGAELPSLFMRRPERVVLLIASLLLGEFTRELVPPYLVLLTGVAALAVFSVVGTVAALRAARSALEPATDIEVGVDVDVDVVSSQNA